MAIPRWDGDSTDFAASLGGKRIVVMPKETNGDAQLGPWLTYRAAAAYTGYSVAYLRNLVSARKIPSYGAPRRRRFRRDMLDLFIADRDAAMRKFLLEQRGTHDR